MLCYNFFCEIWKGFFLMGFDWKKYKLSRNIISIQHPERTHLFIFILLFLNYFDVIVNFVWPFIWCSCNCELYHAPWDYLCLILYWSFPNILIIKMILNIKMICVINILPSGAEILISLSLPFVLLSLISTFSFLHNYEISIISIMA